jgi:hypothetical protein
MPQNARSTPMKQTADSVQLTKPQKGEPYSFLMGNTEFVAGVLNIRKDETCPPYGVVIDMVSEEPPMQGIQCRVNGKGEHLSASIGEVRRLGDIYRFDLLTTFPYPDFWD